MQEVRALKAEIESLGLKQQILALQSQTMQYEYGVLEGQKQAKTEELSILLAEDAAAQEAGNAAPN